MNPKFRLWDDLNKKWLLGYEYPNLGGFSMIGEVMLFGEYTKVISSYRLEDLQYLKIDIYVGKDINGREIYTNDILKHPKATEPEHLGFIVKFSEYRFVCENVYNKEEFTFDDYFCKTEYVGNKHQNPELLQLLQ